MRQDMTPAKRDHVLSSYLESIFESVQEGIVLADKRGLILRANPEFLRMFGYAREEAEGMPLDALVACPEFMEEAARLSRKAFQGERLAVETTRRKKGGELFPVSIMISPIHIDGRLEGVYAIYRDLTSFRQMERSLRDRIEMERGVWEISRNFLAEPDFGRALDFALEKIGRLMEATRACLFFLRENEALLDDMREWRREGVTPLGEKAKGFAAQRVGPWMERLRSGEIIDIPDVATLAGDAPEKGFFEALGVRSLIVFPVFAASSLAGFVCVENEIASKTWEEADLLMLRLAAEVLGTALSRRKAEGALRETTRRYEALFNRSDDGVFLFDFNGVHLAVNDRGAEMLGYKKEELIGKDAQVNLASSEYDEPRRRLDALVSGEILPLYERFIQHKDGSLVPVEINSTVVCDDRGNPHHIQSIVRDISERKQTEAALRESEEKYRQLVERANDGIVIIQAGKIEYVNSRMAELAGGKTEVILGRRFAEFIHPDELVKVGQIYEARMAGRQVPSIYETTLRRLDGLTLEAEINAGVIHYRGQPADLVMVRDITERKLSSERLMKAMRSSIEAIGATVEKRDPYTAGHQKRVTELACAVAAEMHLDPSLIEGLRMAGVIHDIGKISIPAEILSRPGELSAFEFSLVKTHAQAGYEILKNIDFPWPVAEIVFQHHEKIDGSGYPRGLKGDEILLEAKILSVADVVEAMASHRPYRPAFGVDLALAEIIKHKGTHFDAAIVEATVRIVREGKVQNLLGA